MADAPRLHVIQASYGDCFLLEYTNPDGTSAFWLIDGGPGNQGFAGSGKSTNWCLFSTLNQLEVQKLERLIVTHDDRDHTYGVHALLRTIRPYDEWDDGIKKKPKLKKGQKPAPKKPQKKWERKVVKNAEWIFGRQSIEKYAPVLPIENIWYNDKRLLMKEFTKSVPTKGWMSNVLTWFSERNLCSEEFLNQEWGGKCVTVNNAYTNNLRFAKINMIAGPYAKQLSGNHGFFSSKLRNAVQKPAEIEKQMAIEDTFDFDGLEGNIKNLSTFNTSGVDRSVTNLSSIMFEFQHADYKILMTGDGDGDTLKLKYPDKNGYLFNIFKVMHHGSSNNNIINEGDGLSVVARSRDFFLRFRARKYIISSDILNRTPNPDHDCLIALAKAIASSQEMKAAKTRIYVTNGMDPTGFQIFKYEYDETSGLPNTDKPRKPEDYAGEIWVLSRGADVNFGTVVPTSSPNDTDPNNQYETNWIQIHDDSQYYGYIKKDREKYFKMGSDVLSFFTSYRKLVANYRVKGASDKTSKKIAHNVKKHVIDYLNAKATSLTADVAPNYGRYTESLRPRNNKFKGAGNTVFHLSVIADSSFPMIEATDVRPARMSRLRHDKMTWHDIMVMNLLEVRGLNYKDLRPYNPPDPRLTNNFTRTDGQTLNWVDLPTFIQLIEAEYTQYPAIYMLTNSTAPTADQLLAGMKHWLLKNGSSSPGAEVADLILAGTFLNAFFPEDEVSNFFISLPINMDGVDSVSVDPFHMASPSTVLNMTVQNIRFGIYVPNTTQYAGGARIQTAKLYFELAAPEDDFMRTNAEDFMTWCVPFSNSQWSPRHTFLKHKTALEIRMDWPFTSDALVFCNYEADLILTYKKETNLIAEGSMFYKKGRPATHDIQVRRSEDGLLRALDIMTLLSPTAAIAATVIENLASQINLKDMGIDLKQIIDEDLVLYDVGILMYQHNSGIRAVSIEDIYGTLKIKTLLRLAQQVLPLPEAFSLPENLPDITLQVSNMTASTGQKYGLAFTYETSFGATVAAQVAIGSTGQPYFKFYLYNTLGFTVSQWLLMLQADHLADDFKILEFLGPALDSLTVDYIRLEAGKDGGSWGVSCLAFGVTIGEFSVPDENPIFKLQYLTTDLMYIYASDSTRLDVEASLVLAGILANCTITWDSDRQVINDLLDTEKESERDDGAQSESDTDGQFSGYLDVNISFPSEGPSVGDILHAILDNILEGTGLSTIVESIPEEFLMILESNRFQAVRLRLQKSKETNNKWAISSLFISAKLGGIKDKLQDILPSLKFEAPILKVILSDLGDKKKMAYQVSLGSAFSVAGGLCDINADFVSFPKSSKSQVKKLVTVSLKARPSHEGLPVGRLLQNFADEHFNIRDKVPENFQKAVDSVTIDVAGLSFAKVSANAGEKGSWKLARLNIGISLFGDGWTPFEPFTISGVRLLVLHDFGITNTSRKLLTDTNTEKSMTTVQFGANLKIKEREFQVAFTYATNPKAYSFSFQTAQTLKIVDLVFDIVEMVIEIPDEVESYISSILIINTENFFISYSEGKAEGDIPASVVFSNQGEISLFGIGVSNISVICEKRHGSTNWSSYTVSFALPTPCSPFPSFLNGVPGLDDIKIKNGKFSYFKNEPSRKVFNQRQHTIASTSQSSKGSDVMLSGTIDLSSSSFLKLISSIIKIKEIDVCLQSTAVRIAIPAGDDNGIELFEKLIAIKTFELCMSTKGFSFSAYAELRAGWFCKDVVTSALSIGVQFNGAIGGSAAFSKIDRPFDMPGIYLEDSRFSMVFLTEASSPQSIGVKAGVLIKDIPADNIKASLDMYIDALTPWNSYFKMDIENLTLSNLVKAMTKGKLPSPLDGDILRIGFKKLKVEIVPQELRFTLDAEFYLFSLTGKVQADVDIKSGISFAAHLSVVNILDMVKIHSYKDEKLGPFTFLDTKYKSIASGKPGAPPWLEASTKDDPNLKNCVFALSARLNFLGVKLGAYGVINSQGLQLFLDGSAKTSDSGTKLSLNGGFSLVINQSSMTAIVGFDLKIGLDFEDINLLGISIGSYKGTLIGFSSNITLIVNYGGSDWNSNGVTFTVWVEVQVLKFKISGTCKLEISLKKLSDIPKAISSWVEREVVRKLKDGIIKPIEEGVRKVGEFVETASKTLKEELNAATHEIVSLLEESGHTLDDIVSVVRNDLNVTLNSCVRTLTNFGHDLSSISDAVGLAYMALPGEVLFGLHSAGLPTEQVLEKAFGPIGAVMPLGFNFLGSTVSSFAPFGLGSINDIISHQAVPISLNKVEPFTTLPGAFIQQFIGGGLIRGPSGGGPLPFTMPSPGGLIGILPGLMGRGVQQIAPPVFGGGFQPVSVDFGFKTASDIFQGGFQRIPAPFGGFGSGFLPVANMMPMSASGSFGSSLVGTAIPSSSVATAVPAMVIQATPAQTHEAAAKELERERIYQQVEKLKANPNDPPAMALPLPESFFNIIVMGDSKDPQSIKDPELLPFVCIKEDKSITEADALRERADFLSRQGKESRTLIDDIQMQRARAKMQCEAAREAVRQHCLGGLSRLDRILYTKPLRDTFGPTTERNLNQGVENAIDIIENQLEVFTTNIIKDRRLENLDRETLEETAKNEREYIEKMRQSNDKIVEELGIGVSQQVDNIANMVEKLSQTPVAIPVAQPIVRPVQPAIPNPLELVHHVANQNCILM